MIGIDEVGRGCWAGPLLVVAARKVSKLPNGLTDSKLLNKKQRESLFEQLTLCAEFGEGWVSAEEIDKLGLAGAIKIGISKALNSIDAMADEEIILDGAVNYISDEFKNSKCIVGADLNIPIVSAASIYAKVIRDRFMSELSKIHPNYGFDKHVGYGTKIHKDALLELGVLPTIHRVSFKPIKSILETAS